MKLCVMNFSGNVGKSTIARHLLAPRLDDCHIIGVESINADDGSDAAVRGREFRELGRTLAALDAAVVDVGASNVEEFLARMAQQRGAHEDFDAFVVPTAPTTKQLRDTISTISALNELGVEPSRIRLVLNLAERGEDPHKLFGPLFELDEFCATPRALIYENEIYSLLRDSDQSISGLVEDTTDYRGLMRATDDKVERIRLAEALAMRRLALGVKDDLDAAWAALWAE